MAVLADEQLAAALDAHQPALGQPRQAELGHRVERTEPPTGRAAYARRAVISPDDARRFARRADRARGSAGGARRRRPAIRPASTPPTTAARAAGARSWPTEPMAAPAGATAWRVRYRTLDAADRPVAASMAVAAPTGPAADAPARRRLGARRRSASRPGAARRGAGFEAWYGERLLRRGVRRRGPRPHRPRRRGHDSTRTSTVRRPAVRCSTRSRAAAELPATGAGARRRPRRALGRRARRAVGQRAGGRPTTAPASTCASPCRCRRSVICPSPWPTTPTPPARPRSRCSWRRRGPDIEPVVPADALTPAALARLDDLAHEAPGRAAPHVPRRPDPLGPPRRPDHRRVGRRARPAVRRPPPRRRARPPRPGRRPTTPSSSSWTRDLADDHPRPPAPTSPSAPTRRPTTWPSPTPRPRRRCRRSSPRSDALRSPSLGLTPCGSSSRLTCTGCR